MHSATWDIPMVYYLLTRLAGLIGVVLGVSLITFLLMHAVPGSPFDVMAVQRAQMIPEEIKQQLLHKYGLDKPVWEQYLIFLKNALRLDFGYSFASTGRTVVQIFADQ